MVIIFIFLSGLFLRLYQLGKASLWFDEAYSIFNGQHLLSVIKKMGTLSDRYPSFLSDIPIYLWYRCFGKDEFTLRLFSVLFGLCTILLIYKFTCLIFDKKIALVAAFLLTISPIHIYYSQELRIYSLMSLLSLSSVFFLVKAIRRGMMRFWIWYVIFNVLNIYIHHMAILLLFAQLVFFLIFIRDYRKLSYNWFFYNVVILILLIPWFTNSIYLFKIAIKSESCLWIPSWAESVGIKNLFYTIKNFSIGYNINEKIYIPITVIFLITLVFGITRVKKEDTKMFVLCLCCSLIPALSMFSISQVKVWYVDRYILSSLSFYYILLAYCLMKIKTKYIFLWLGIVVFSYAIALNNYYRSSSLDPKSCVGVGNKYDYRNASAYLTHNFKKGDVIFHASYSSTTSFMYYAKKNNFNNSLNEIRPIVLFFTKDENRIEAKEFLLKGCKFRAVAYNDFVSDKKRIWLLCSDWVFDTRHYLGTDVYKVAHWMQDNYREKEEIVFKGIILYLFEKS